ncbi:MAG: ABC transporter permease [Pseudomonadota bacterium]
MRVDLVLGSWEMFAEGVWMTLQLTALALVFGFLIALPAALSMHRRTREAPLWRGFVYVFRGTPLLVQTYLIYYGLAQFDWVRGGPWWLILREAWWCALIAFSLNSAAYQAEILRGAFATVPRGEIEGGKALGLSRRLVTLLVLLPSGFRRALPQYGNEVVFMLHGSVVASVITLQDILGAGRTLNARYYLAYEGLLTAAVLYMALTFLLVGAFRLLEGRFLRHLNVRRPEGHGGLSAAVSRPPLEEPEADASKVPLEAR